MGSIISAIISCRPWTTSPVAFMQFLRKETKLPLTRNDYTDSYTQFGHRELIKTRKMFRTTLRVCDLPKNSSVLNMFN